MVDVQVDESELIISLYHPKIHHLYLRFNNLIRKKIYNKLSVTAKKLYDHLEDINKGLSPEGFRLKMESLGFSEDFREQLVQKYEKYCALNEDDYQSLFCRVSNFILDNAIRDAVDNYNNNHEVYKFIDLVSSFKSNELSDKFADEKLFTSCLFGDIDVSKVQEDFVQGTIQSSFNLINESSSLGGYIKGQMVVFAAPTKCGKSMISMQECVNFLQQGLHCTYCALGDLKQYDFLYRMSAQINHRPMPYVENNLIKEVADAKTQVPEIAQNLNIQLLAPAKFSAEEVANFIKTTTVSDGVTSLHDWSDVIIIDYDSNFASNAESMYTKGEDIYQTLYQLVYPNKLVIVLAQTNKPSWDEEIIGVGELGESSRKQQIVDILVTISHPSSQNALNQVGYMNLCAGRRCRLNKTPYFRDIDGCFHEISTDLYESIKNSVTPKSMIPDITRYQKYLTQNYDFIGIANRKSLMQIPSMNQKSSQKK